MTRLYPAQAVGLQLRAHVPRYTKRREHCFGGAENSAGWDTQYERRILKHLEEQDLPVPTRNIGHLFPRS
jgi:hypothetical protein